MTMDDTPSQDEVRRSRLRSMLGRECIYWEKRIIVHTAVREVALSAEAAMVSLQDLRSPGFLPPEHVLGGAYEGVLTVGVAWNEGSFDADEWRGSAYAPWTVYLSPALVRNVRALSLRIADKPPRRRYALLLQRLRDGSSATDGTSAARLATHVHALAGHVLEGRVGFLYGALSVATEFWSRSLEDDHPDFRLFLELAERVRPHRPIFGDWRTAQGPEADALRSIVQPYEERVLNACRRLRACQAPAGLLIVAK